MIVHGYKLSLSFKAQIFPPVIINDTSDRAVGAIFNISSVTQCGKKNQLKIEIPIYRLRNVLKALSII